MFEICEYQELQRDECKLLVCRAHSLTSYRIIDPAVMVDNLVLRIDDNVSEELYGRFYYTDNIGSLLARQTANILASD